MHRENLGFLNAMFAESELENHNILVVNQTETKVDISHDYPNLKIINSEEFGLSKSRNLAIRHATKKLLLIADDDVVFLEGFSNRIIDAYNSNPTSDFICFQTLTTQLKPYRNYPIGTLKKSQLNKVLSIEMSFKKEFIEKHNLRFDENFGLGAEFSDTENVHFLHAIFRKKATMIGAASPIVIHEPLSSSDDVASPRLMYARGASFYKRYGEFAYFWVMKYGFFLWRKGYAKSNEIKSKLKPMFDGIKDYKALKS